MNHPTTPGSALADQWLELFRSGDYGEKGNFTDADLDQIAANYNPAEHEAPAVVGHPESDAPAYAWVESLRREGNTLLGKLKQVAPEFEDMVRAGRFKKRSVALYKSAKGWALRHVGWLGAQPPAVKGLRDAQFGQDGMQPAVEYIFEESSVDENNLVQKFLDGVKALFKEHAPAAGEGPKFSEQQVKDMIAAAVQPLQTELTTVKTQFSERQASDASATMKAKAEAAISRLKANKFYLNAFDKMGLPAVFAELAKSETQLDVEFEEGGEKKTKKVSPLELAVAFFEKLPELVPSGEVFTGQPSTRTVKGQQINETAQVKVDPASVAFDERVKAYAADKKLDYGSAYRELVMNGEGPQAAATAGAV